MLYTKKHLSIEFRCTAKTLKKKLYPYLVDIGIKDANEYKKIRTFDPFQSKKIEELFFINKK